jgi:hypothetical protein
VPSPLLSPSPTSPSLCTWTLIEQGDCSVTCGIGWRRARAACTLQEDSTRLCDDRACDSVGVVKEACQIRPCPPDRTASPTSAPIVATIRPTMLPYTPLPTAKVEDVCIVEDWSAWSDCTDKFEDGSCCGTCVKRRFRKVPQFDSNPLTCETVVDTIEVGVPARSAPWDWMSSTARDPSLC